MTKIEKISRFRRHTYLFLEKARENCPIYLSMDIDMSTIQQYRNNENKKLSYIAFLIQTISKVLKQYPCANSAIKAGFIPKVAYYDSVTAKFTLDKSVASERVVVAGFISNSDQLSLEDIQEKINYYKESTLEESEAFHSLRKTFSLPFTLFKWLYNFMLNNLKRRDKFGTFTITSLGHRPIKAFFPISGTTLAFGVGAIKDTPVVQDDKIQACPLLELCMVFDHRLLDGAMAADILFAIKNKLENDYQN